VTDGTDQGEARASDSRPTQDGGRDARGRFGPGNPGGPGRPVGGRSKVVLELDAIGQERAEEIIRSLAERAVAGDNAAAEILLRRVWIPTRARAVKVDLPKISTAADARSALSLIVEAAAAGDMDLDSAKILSEIVEKRASSLELQELQDRFEALEARVNGTA
jgi:hypothetical protein